MIALTKLQRHWPRAISQPVSRNGFTLLELLLVMVIAAMTIGLVSMDIMQSNSQALQKETQSIALLLQLGREEAILRNRPVAFEVDPEYYRFLVRENNEWQELSDDMLHRRTFQKTPLHASITPAQINDNINSSALRIVFGREPVDKPFLMTLSVGDARAAIRADGVGHFSLEKTQ